MRGNSFQSTLRCRTWLAPEAAVVKASTACTLAEATAGDTPRTLKRAHVELLEPERHADRAVDQLARRESRLRHEARLGGATEMAVILEC